MNNYTIRTTLKRGSEHSLNCEDALAVVETNQHIFAAVCDGCSTGIKSHFASELMAKLFKKSTHNIDLTVCDYNITIADEIVHRLLRYLSDVHMRYEVKVEELLSTIVFAIVDKKTGVGYIVWIGDGVAVVNGETHIVDQNNTPDYLAYHFIKLYDGTAKNYIMDMCSSIILPEVIDISICSDGILSFQQAINNNGNITIDKSDIPSKYAMASLCIDTSLIGSDAMLSRKCNILEKKGYIHYDDLSIIRIIKQEKNAEI